LGNLILKHPNASVKALILFKLEALLGHIETVLMLFLELLTKVMLNAPLFLFHATIGFHLVALPQHGHFSFKTHQVFVAKTALLTRDGFSALFGQFRFHCLTHLTLDLLEGALALKFVPHHKVALLRENPLTQFLLTKTSFTAHLPPKTFFFVVACAHMTFLFSAGAVGLGELSTQG
tara:strand:- start:3188 stop:3718 length:531 start_codon:yes stop_codon:yes gene_type:complete